MSKNPGRLISDYYYYYLKRYGGGWSSGGTQDAPEFEWESEKPLSEAAMRCCADEAYYSLQVFLHMRLRKERRNPRRNRDCDLLMDKSGAKFGGGKGGYGREGGFKGICPRAETDQSITTN